MKPDLVPFYVPIPSFKKINIKWTTMPGFPNISLDPTKVPLYTLMRPKYLIMIETHIPF